MHGLLIIAWLAAAPIDTPAATRAPDSHASPVISQRKFPWYDQEKQAYVPIRPDSESNWLERLLEWLFGKNEGKTSGLGLQGVLLILLVAVLAWLGYLFYKSLNLNQPEHVAEPEIPVLDTARLEALPLAVRNVTDFLREAERLAQAGDFNAAMVFYYSWQLVTLNQAGILELEVGKTNRQYIRETIRNCPDLRELFQKTSRLFEDAFYGNVRLTAEAFERLWRDRNAFLKPPLTAGRHR